MITVQYNFPSVNIKVKIFPPVLMAEVALANDNSTKALISEYIG